MPQLSPSSIDKLNNVLPVQAYPITIRETTGQLRQITLRGASLPYKGVPFPSELRLKKKYYAGNPQAEAQVLGSMWPDTEMTGRWSDNMLSRNDSQALLVNFPPTSPSLEAGSGGGNTFSSVGQVASAVTSRARVIRDAMYLLQRGGQLLEVTWGSIRRYGFIQTFEPKHHTENDIHWTLSWTWTGDTNAPLRTKQSLSAELSAFQALVAVFQAAINAMNAALAQMYGNVATVTQRITRLGQLITDFIEAVQGFASLAFVPAEIVGSVKQSLTSIALAASDLVNLLRSGPAAYNLSKLGYNPTEQALQEELIRAIIYNALILGVESKELANLARNLSAGEIIGIVIMPAGQTLRDVSREQYGSADGWQTIAEYNGFASSLVPVGTPIRIPKKV